MLITPEDKGVGGVYVITHEYTGGKYVGSTNDFYGRIYAHTYDLKVRRHCNQPLQEAYDLDKRLIFEKVVVCNERDIAFSEEKDLLARMKAEGLLIFNIADDPRSPTKGRSLSDVTKKKISDANTGRMVSAETCEKMSAARTGVSATEEHKHAIREAKREAAREVYINGDHFRSLSDAADILEIPYKIVRRRIESTSPLHVDWEYRNDLDGE